MDTVKIGIIGAGAIAKQHLLVLRDIEWMKVVGITSRTIEKAESLAKEYGIAKCTDNIDSLILQTHPDALMVLVSIDQMYKVACEVIPYGLPLFLEKPVGLSPEENLDLVERAKRYKVRSMVGFNRRYYSIFHKGMDIIHRYGPLMGVAIEGHERMWLKRDNPNKFSEEVLSRWIYANSIHTIDLIRFFAGEPIKVMSLAHKYREPMGDQFVAILELESGALGQYSAYWYSPGGWKVILYGDGITVEFNPLENGRWIDKDFKTPEIIPDEVDVRFKPGFFRQMEAFGKLVKDGSNDWPLQDLEGSYKTMLLAEQISANISDCSFVQKLK